jgi:hypothetical protein
MGQQSIEKYFVRGQWRGRSVAPAAAVAIPGGDAEGGQPKRKGQYKAARSPVHASLPVCAALAVLRFLKEKLMVRVPLFFRGVAVLLLAASTVVGQTPEPPVEFPSLDSLAPHKPDFLRQLSSDARHPLLALMVDGELTSLDAPPAQEPSKPGSSKLKPTPQTPKTGSSDGVLLDGPGCPSDDCGGLLDDCPFAAACPTVPNCLPFACPPPPSCCGRKFLGKFGRKHCGGCDHGVGCGWCPAANPYLGWPCCPAWCFYGAPLVPGNQGCCGRGFCCRHKRNRCDGYGYPYCGGYGGWGIGPDGFVTVGFCDDCMPYTPPPCGCRKCQKHFKHNRGWGYDCPWGGWGMGYDGWVDGGFCGCVPPPPPPPCCCRKCQRKHGYSYGYGYGGWDGCYGCAAPYYACGGGKGKHHGGFGLFHRCRGCQPPPPPCPFYPVPLMMPCMSAGPFCADCTFEGDGVVMGEIIN